MESTQVQGQAKESQGRRRKQRIRMDGAGSTIIAGWLNRETDGCGPKGPHPFLFSASVFCLFNQVRTGWRQLSINVSTYPHLRISSYRSLMLMLTKRTDSQYDEMAYARRAAYTGRAAKLSARGKSCRQLKAKLGKEQRFVLVNALLSGIDCLHRCYVSRHSWH